MSEQECSRTHACVVCTAEKDCRQSLRLTRGEKGKWQTNPVCASCRSALIADAKREGKFIPFFNIEVSLREAEKRNDQAKLNRPFLAKFAKCREVNNPKPDKAKVVSLKATAS